MILFILSLYFQNIRGYSALLSGFILLALTLAYGGSSLFVGKLIDRIGERIPLIISMALLTIGFYLLSHTSLTSHMSFFVIPLLLIGLGWGISVTATVSAALKSVPDAQISVASGILYTVIYIEWAIGVAVTGLILILAGRHVFNELIQQSNLHLSVAQQTSASGVYSGVHSGNLLLQQFENSNVGKTVLTLGQRAFMEGFKIAMLVTTFLHVVGLIASNSIKTDSSIV
jgi:MFS family permease